MTNNTHTHAEGIGSLIGSLETKISAESLDLTNKSKAVFPDHPHADHIFYGNIITMDENNPSAEAVAIKHGKIIGVGSKQDIEHLKGPLTKEIPLGNDVMYPGLIEPHMHIWATAVFYRFIDCSPITYKSLDEIFNNIKQNVEKSKKGEPIFGQLFDPSLLPGYPDITKEQLDKISLDNPLFIMNASMHIAYVNSKSLELAGITDSTPDPSGGHYQKDADGHLTGVLLEPATFIPVLRKLQHVNLKYIKDLVQNIESITKDASRVGVTTMRDAYTGELMGYQEIELANLMHDLGMLKTRLNLALGDNKKSLWVKKEVKPQSGNDFVRIGAWKLVSDGSNQGRTGYMNQNYLNTDTHGYPDCTPEYVQETIEFCNSNGWQLMIHANGDKAIQIAVDKYYEVLKDKPDNNLRHRIEHCSFVDNKEYFKKMHSVGVNPSFLINHVYYWGKAFQDVIVGKERANHLDMIKSAMDSGLIVTMHSDYNVTNINPLHYVKVAATRSEWDGGDVLNSNEIMSVYEGMKAITNNAAWQLHMEDKIGSITEGKYADFVILEKDPQKVEPADIDKISVLQTWMNGKVTHSIK